MKVALTIGGFDPSSGAGITADLGVFSALGLFGTASITATTVQSTLGVRSVHPFGPELLRATLDELCSDMPPAGIKIGMLATDALTRAVADFLEHTRATPPIPVVLDPVLRASSGALLLEPEAIGTLRERLLPLVSCVTPNVDELAVLLGRELDGRDAILAGAQALQESGNALNVIVTGGDQQRPEDLVLTTQGEARWLEGNRVETTSTHGTGCAFASALLGNLLRGHSVPDAAVRAKGFVEGALHRAPGLGHGKGPADLIWPIR